MSFPGPAGLSGFGMICHPSLITTQKSCAIEWGKSPEMFGVPFLISKLAVLIAQICQKNLAAIEALFVCRCLLFLLLHVQDLDAMISCGESRCLTRAPSW